MKNHRHPCALAALAGLLLTLSGLLAACGDKCDGMDCPPCNAFINDIVVVFARDSLQGGFRKAEKNGGYAVRYRAPGFNVPVDTVRQTRNGANFYQGLISLQMLAWPGALTGASQLGLEAYSYRFVLPALNRTYDINNVEMQTRAGDTGSCCDCGENVRRRFTLNSVPVVLDGNANNERPAFLRR